MDEIRRPDQPYYDTLLPSNSRPSPIDLADAPDLTDEDHELALVLEMSLREAEEAARHAAIDKYEQQVALLKLESDRREAAIQAAVDAKRDADIQERKRAMEPFLQLLDKLIITDAVLKTAKSTAAEWVSNLDAPYPVFNAAEYTALKRVLDERYYRPIELGRAPDGRIEPVLNWIVR